MTRLGRSWVVILATVACVSFMAAAPPTARASDIYAAGRSIGYDVSWPNCGSRPPAHQFAVVGVTGGHPFSANPCLAAEFATARRPATTQLYLNITAPVSSHAAMGRTGPAGTCSSVQQLCRAYNYGYNAAREALAYAARRLGDAAVRTTWWLDVELGFGWSSSTRVNARAIAGALAYIRGRHLAVGVYSTAFQWRTIAGRYRPGSPIWYATVSRSAIAARRHCATASSFTGGPVRMVQYAPGGLDADVTC